MNEVKPVAPKCPLCGGEVLVVEHILYEKDRKTVAAIQTHFNCCIEGCKAETIISLPLAEALTRFSTRPESVEAKILQRFKDDLNKSYDKAKMSSCNLSEEAYLKSFLNYINLIEKELKK